MTSIGFLLVALVAIVLLFAHMPVWATMLLLMLAVFIAGRAAIWYLMYGHDTVRRTFWSFR